MARRRSPRYAPEPLEARLNPSPLVPGMPHVTTTARKTISEPGSPMPTGPTNPGSPPPPPGSGDPPIPGPSIPGGPGLPRR